MVQKLKMVFKLRHVLTRLQIVNIALTFLELHFIKVCLIIFALSIIPT